ASSSWTRPPQVGSSSSWPSSRRRRLSSLEGDLVAALEAEDFAGFVGRGDLVAQTFDDLARELDLLGVGLGEPAGAGPERVFHANADVAAHGSRHGRNRELIAPGAQHGPVILVAEQAVGRAFHVRHILRVRADAAEDAEHGLDEER